MELGLRLELECVEYSSGWRPLSLKEAYERSLLRCKFNLLVNAGNRIVRELLK